MWTTWNCVSCFPAIRGSFILGSERGVEEALAEAMKTNKTLTKIGYAFDDARVGPLLRSKYR